MVLGGPEFARRHDRGQDRLPERLVFLPLRLGSLGEALLLVAVVENCRPVLRAGVAELAVGHRRIMVEPELLEQPLVAQLGRVVDHLHHLGVPGDSRGHFLVGGVLLLSAHVSGSGREHAGKLVERFLRAPETARCERRLLQVLSVQESRDQQQGGKKDPDHFLSSFITASMTGWSRRHSRTLRSGELRTAATKALAQMSSGTAKMPLETAGNDTDCQPRSSAQRNAASSACRSLSSSLPSPKRGPTAWITPLNGSSPAVVTTALPVGIGPRLRTMRSDSSCSAAPAAREMIPATQPPCASWPLAALTMASTASSSRLPRTTSKIRPGATSSRKSVSCVGAPCYSIFAFALSSRTSPSTLPCTSCCWMRGRTSVRAGNFTCRTSSSWMTWKPKRVRTGVSVYLPFSSFTMTSANCGSNTLGTFQSRSPPRSLVPLSFEFLVAGLGLRAVVFLLHVVVRDRVLAHPVADIRAHQDFLSRQVELGQHLGGLRHPRALRFLRHDLAVDQLVAHHGARLVVVRSAASGLLLHHELHPRARHRHAVHGGDSPRFGGGLRRRLGAVFRLGLGEGKGRRREHGDCEHSNLHRVPFSSSGLRAVMASA